jgi:hypothetical protein
MTFFARCGVAALCSMAILTQAFAQGVYFETSDSKPGENGSRVWYMPHMIKAIDADNSETIVRLDRKELYSVDPEKKTYTVMTFAELKERYNGAKEKMEAYLQQELKNLSPEQKKLVEGRIAASREKPSEPRVDAKATGRSKQISGYTCHEYILSRNGKEEEHVWTTADLKESGAMRQDLEQFHKEMASIVGSDERALGWMGLEEGFPLERDEAGDVETVTKIERGSYPLSDFEVPSGFTREKADTGDAQDN